MVGKNEKNLAIEGASNKGCFIKIRYIQVSLLTFAIIILMGMRTCFSVAIIAMTSTNTSSNSNIPTYNWTNNNIILSSFYWSYALPQFIAGNLAHIFGAKWLLFSSIFTNSLASILSVRAITADHFGANGVMFLRILQGLTQGFLIPMVHAVLGRWIPSEEISIANSVAFAGCTIGTVLPMVITGYLSASAWGWPAAFYLFGIIGIILSILWIVLSAETPASHTSISIEERKYIEQSLGQEEDHLIIKKSIPWKGIFTSLPYWAVIVAAIGESWGSTFYNSEIPNYFSHAVGLNIQESSLYLAVPVLGNLIVGLCSGPVSAYTINKGYLSVANSRRVFHGFGAYTFAVCFLLIPYIEDKVTVAILLVAAVSASSTITLGFGINNLDISPRYAGALTGISNGTGQLVAIFAPIFVQFVVVDETDKKLWRSMFILASAITILTATFFIVFCSGERQWWDNVDRDKLKEDSCDYSSGGRTNEEFTTDDERYKS